MWHVLGTIVSGGGKYIHLGFTEGWKPTDTDEGMISFDFGPATKLPDHRQLTKSLREIVAEDGLGWIIPGPREWVIDLNKLTEEIPEAKTVDWLRGKISMEPETDLTQKTVGKNLRYNQKVIFYLTKELLNENRMLTGIPVEITESLKRFQLDHPEPSKVAFVMMEFSGKKAHDRIFDVISNALESQGIECLRADKKRYHTHLYWNVMTYIYGSGLGIAVLDRIASDMFNPNIAFEFGYMRALVKPVCLLTDQTLAKLYTDIIGYLYDPFDVHDPEGTSPQRLDKWLADQD
jgi:hypothetical protein